MQLLDLQENFLCSYTVAEWIYRNVDLSAFHYTHHNARGEWYTMQHNGRWRKGGKCPPSLDEKIYNSVYSALVQMGEHGSPESNTIKKAIRKIRSTTFRSQVRRTLERLVSDDYLLYCPDEVTASGDDATGFGLDSNLDLLPFSNGVYDFIQKKFRAILPSDCISRENGLDRTFPMDATEEAQKEFIQTFRPEFASIVAVRPNTTHPSHLCVKVMCPRCSRQNSHGVPKCAGRERRICDGCMFGYYIRLK